MATEGPPEKPRPQEKPAGFDKHGAAASKYLEGLWRRKVAILLAVMLIVGVVMVVASSRPTIYRATAEVLVQTGGVEAALDAADRPDKDPRRLVETEIRILGSSAVRAAAGTTLGGQPPPVVAAPAGKADVIEVTAESGIPAEAAEIANAYADAYVKLRTDQVAAEMTAAVTELQSRIADLDQQISAQSASPAARDPLVQQQVALRQQVDRLEVFKAAKTGAAQVVVPASVPQNPISPNPGRAGVLAAIMGLVLAIGVAVVLERFDDSVRNKDDLERILNVPVLGTIPVVGGWASGPRPPVVSLATPRSPATEAYRSLRTSLQFAPEERLATIQITSPVVGDGKTTTLANLGVAFARAGLQVVLVCCDLRRPSLHEFFGLTNDVGFTSVLLGKVPLTAALQEVPDQDRLYVLASGPLPPNPSELLASRRAREVMGSLRVEADIVLIDSPPVLPVSDALVIAGLVDVTVLVCAAGRTSAKEVSRALEALAQVDAPLAGVVLNGEGSESDYGAKYGYDSPNGMSGAHAPVSPRPETSVSKVKRFAARVKGPPET
jgi:capsular exopolysaccharide synthesis family protein